MKGVVFHIALDVAQSPVDGECIVDHWWSVHPEHGVAFYAQLTGYLRSEEPSPQCNYSEGTARLLAQKLYPDYEVARIPVVFLRHAHREMLRLRKEQTRAKAGAA